MKGYKAFKKGLICRGKQYKENTVFEEENAEICECGMHFCKDPLEVLNYYPLVGENGCISEFAEVEALDDCKTNDNKKYCTKKLKIGAKISFIDLVKASVGFDFEKNTIDKSDYTKISSSGDYTHIGSSGIGANISSSGNDTKINATGENSVICCAGIDSIVKAKIGSWITLSEWRYDSDKREYIPTCVKTEYVDGVKIKEDTFYQLKDGEFSEVE